MLVAVGLCYRDYGLNWACGAFLAEAALGVGTGFVAIKYVPQTAAGKKMILSHEQTAMRAGTEHSPELVGEQGVAQTVLRPSGMALVGGKRHDVVAESGMIESGSAIKVVAVEGTRIIVRKL
jgi:membrane-bound serine protease (ClpP class)